MPGPPDPFRYAPPPTRAGGRTAVPIDIHTIDAVLHLDAHTGRCTADAYLEFTQGPHDGHPVFDLRQQIESALLDGDRLSPDDLPHCDLGGGPEAAMRVIRRRLQAGTRHSLHVSYALATPQAPRGGSRLPEVHASDGRARLSFGMSDLAPGRYLESWIPANLLFDQYSIDIGITVANAAAPHVLITSGRSIQIAENRWWVEFRPGSTSCSPMVELHPADEVVCRRATVRLPVSDKDLEIEIWKPRGMKAQLSRLLGKVSGWLCDFERRMGRYCHGRRFVVFLQDRGGMEYDGGCTSSVEALWHETHHAWWARGLKPPSQRDGWIDEAWTVYSEKRRGVATPFDLSRPAPLLNPENPWWRVTPAESYDEGCLFFEGLADIAGTANLEAWMDEFCRESMPGFVTTGELEDYLFERSGGDRRIRAAFARIRGAPPQTRTRRISRDRTGPRAAAAERTRPPGRAPFG